MQPLWSSSLSEQPRGLGLARERGWLLAWSGDSWLRLLDYSGHLQAQRKLPGAVTAACVADDGSAIIAVGDTTLWWLAADLTTRWQMNLSAPALAIAVDSFGQYVAVSDHASGLRYF